MTAFPVALVLYERHISCINNFGNCRTGKRNPIKTQDGQTPRQGEPSAKDVPNLEAQDGVGGEQLQEPHIASATSSEKCDNAEPKTRTNRVESASANSFSEINMSRLSRWYLKLMTRNTVFGSNGEGYKLYYAAIVSVLFIVCLGGFLFSRGLMLGTPSGPGKWLFHK